MDHSAERPSPSVDQLNEQEAQAEPCQEKEQNKPAASGQDDPQTKYQQGSRWVWAFFVASIVSSPFLFGFDLVVVGAVQPRIVRTLGEVDKLPWVSVAYALAAMTVSGAASNMNTFIGGRALSGVGAVGTYVGAMNTLAVVTTIQQRPLYYSFITFAYGLSTILAPVIGGAFSDSPATWRWAFYINICVCGLFLPGYLVLFPSEVLTPRSVTIQARIKRLDLVGNILWTGMTTSGLMAVSFGGAVYAWGSGQIIGLFVCFGVLTILLCAQQYMSFLVAPQFRLFPVQFLKSLEMVILFIQIASSTATATLPIFLIPLYFEFVRGSSAIQAGLHLLPLVIFRSVFILVNGFFMPKFGYVMPWYLAGSVLCLAGSAPFLVLTPDSRAAAIYGFCVLIGSGAGMYNQASFAVAQARTPPAQVPLAGAFITAGQVVGSAVALAVANTVFLNRAVSMVQAVLPDVAPQNIQESILGGLSLYLTRDLSPQQQSRVLSALVKALNEAWATVVAASALSVVAAVFMKRDKLYK